MFISLFAFSHCIYSFFLFFQIASTTWVTSFVWMRKWESAQCSQLLSCCRNCPSVPTSPAVSRQTAITVSHIAVPFSWCTKFYCRVQSQESARCSQACCVHGLMHLLHSTFDLALSVWSSSVQFSSRWHLCAQKGPWKLLKVFPCCICPGLFWCMPNHPQALFG